MQGMSLSLLVKTEVFMRDSVRARLSMWLHQIVRIILPSNERLVNDECQLQVLLCSKNWLTLMIAKGYLQSIRSSVL